MGSARHTFIALLVSLTNIAGVFARADPSANCGTVVDEREYSARGGVLIEKVHANLAKFPKGFLGVSCAGGFTLEGIVQEDGSVSPSGIDGAATCDAALNSGNLKSLDRSIWRGAVIGERLKTLRYEPPRLADTPVCVRIRRIWMPNSPHKFWFPQERTEQK